MTAADQPFRLFVRDYGSPEFRAMPSGYKTYDAAEKAGEKLCLTGGVTGFEIWEMVARFERDFVVTRTGGSRRDDDWPLDSEPEPLPPEVEAAFAAPKLVPVKVCYEK